MDYTWTTTSPPTAEPLTTTEVKSHLRVSGSDDDTFISGLITAARQYCEGFQTRAYMARTIQLKRDDWYDKIYLPFAPLYGVDSITYVDSGGDTQTLSSSVYAVETLSEPGFIYLDYQQVWPSVRGTHNDITINYNCGNCANFTVNATTDVITCASRTFTDTQRIRLYNTDGALPAGLSADTDYYVRDVSGNTFKLAASSGGAAIDITGAGTGTHYIGKVPQTILLAMKLLIGHWYENREASTELQLKEVPLAVKNLLWQDRLIGF